MQLRLLFVLVAFLSFIGFVLSKDSCDGHDGQPYISSSECWQECTGISCSCQSGSVQTTCRYNKALDTIATWVIVIIVIGVLITISPCVILCIGMCFCGWFGVCAVTRRSGQAGYVHSQHPQQTQPITVYTTTTPASHVICQQPAVAPGYYQ